MSNINYLNNLQSLKKITEIANLNKDYLENINNLIQQNNNLLENANKFNKLKSIALWVMATFAAIILAIGLSVSAGYYIKKKRDSIAISNQSDIFLKRVNSEEKNIGKDGMIAFSYQPEKILPIIPSADSIVFDGLKIDVEVYDPLKNNSNKDKIKDIEELRRQMDVPTCTELIHTFGINENGKSPFLEGALINDDKDIKPMKNVLLHGGSGTGKTYLLELMKKYYKYNNNGYITLKINAFDLFNSSKKMGSPDSLDFSIKSFRENFEFLIKTVTELNKKYNEGDNKNKKQIVVLFDEFDKFLNHEIFKDRGYGPRMMQGDFTYLANKYMEDLNKMNVINLFTSNALVETTHAFNSTFQNEINPQTSTNILFGMFESRLAGLDFRFRKLDLNLCMEFIEKNLDPKIFNEKKDSIQEEIEKRMEKHLNKAKDKIHKDILREKTEKMFDELRSTLAHVISLNVGHKMIPQKNPVFFEAVFKTSEIQEETLRNDVRRFLEAHSQGGRVFHADDNVIDYVNSKIVEHLNGASLQEDMNEIKKKCQEINQEYDEKEKYRISEIQDLDYRELDAILNKFKISHNLEIKSATTTTSELKK